MLLIVFVHYNAKNLYDDYVDYYLDALMSIQEEKQLIFVSTSKLPKDTHKQLQDKNIKIIERKNEGYDFYSYKLAIKSVNTKKFSSILICNDSAFGPFFELNTIYKSMQSINGDIIGLTKSTEETYHLQSYFILFKNSVIHSQAFQKFWEQVGIISDRSKVIETYELGLSKFFIKHQFKLNVFCNLDINCSNLIFHSEKKYLMLRKCFRYLSRGKLTKINEVNPTHYFWRHLITNYNFPFVKRELIDKNPENLNISNLPTFIETLTQYPKILFKRH